MNATTTKKIKTPRWVKPFLDAARYKGAKGGRGSGKSHMFAEEVVIRSIVEQCDIVCMREKQRSLKFSAKKLVEAKINQFGLQDYFVIQQCS